MIMITIIRKIQSLFKKKVKKEWDFKKELQDFRVKNKDIILKLADAEKRYFKEDLETSIKENIDIINALAKREKEFDFDKTSKERMKKHSKIIKSLAKK